MHLAFVDFVYFYDAARPDSTEPLGGTTSAICFLARELTQAGVTCTFFNRIESPAEAHGITSLPLTALTDAVRDPDFDAFIFCGRWSEALVNLVRAHTRVPLIAWMHESAFQDPMTPALDAFDGVVFVSEWQRRVNQSISKTHWRQEVIRNAVNPAIFEGIEHDAILPLKKNPPVLLFAGSFVRGAFHIPPLLDRIRRHRIDFQVQLFCNLNPSRDPQKDALYIEWLRGLPNMMHVGMVGQRELTRHMAAATLMLAPNPWPETSCIALMEGLASGMMVVTTNRAALPETASGFARLVPIDRPDDQTRFDMPIDYDAFAENILVSLEAFDRKQPSLELQLRRQVDYFQKEYQWAHRVAPWVTFIEGFSKA